MDELGLNLEGIPRLLDFPLRVKHLGYRPVNFHNRKTDYQSIDFCLALSGDGSGFVVSYDGREHRAAFPCAVLHLPGHYYETSTERPWEVLYIVYDAAALPLVERVGMDKMVPVWEFQRTPRLRAVVAELFDLAGRTHERGVCDKIDALCYELIVETWTTSGVKDADADPNEKTIRQIASYFELNYAKDIRFDKLLKKHAVSRRTFFRCWKKLYGISPYNYVLGLRVKAAERLLQDASRPVQEIAAAVGFEDPLYFSRLFRRKTGRSPTDCRRRGVPA